jgi:hypothetical protein
LLKVRTYSVSVQASIEKSAWVVKRSLFWLAVRTSAHDRADEGSADTKRHIRFHALMELFVVEVYLRVRVVEVLDEFACPAATFGSRTRRVRRMERVAQREELWRGVRPQAHHRRLILLQGWVEIRR